MSDIVVSLIRTWVPVAIGGLLTWLGSTFEIVLTGDESQAGIVFITGLIIAIYYGLVRALEVKFPFIGILLGTPQKPVYTEPDTSGYTQ